MTPKKICPFNYETIRPECIIMRTFQYGYLKDFLEDNSKGYDDKMVSHLIDCIEFKNLSINILNDVCIKCFFCVFSCPENRIEVQNEFYLESMCSEFKPDYPNKLEPRIFNDLFHGAFLELPSVQFAQFQRGFSSFQDFTEIHETTNIAVWGAGVLRFLSNNKFSRVGLEIGMNISTRQRGARLDICLLSKDFLYVVEAKVSFKSMMDDNRYITQLLAYEEEIEETLKKFKSPSKHYKFLLIGGPESDLLPPNHPYCTSNIGNLATKFYNSIIDHKFFFISANALLSLGLLKLFKGNLYCIEKLSERLFAENNIGLLSSGLVVKDAKEVVIRDFD